MKKSIDAFAMQIIFIKENDIFVSEKNPGIKYSFMDFHLCKSVLKHMFCKKTLFVAKKWIARNVLEREHMAQMVFGSHFPIACPIFLIEVLSSVMTD